MALFRQNLYHHPIEATLAQAINAFGLRQSRYRGLPKTHLQHVLTSTAMNFWRIANWLEDVPLTPTCRSRFARLAPQSLKHTAHTTA